jgi:ATP-dependent DNA helicase PIF1
VASVKQIPLIPAYALTIHKSQGMTLPKAIIDCKNIFACGQLYVALSRVKSLNELQLLNFHPRQLITAKVVSDYYALVKQELKDSIQLQLPHQHNLDQRE